MKRIISLVLAFFMVLGGSVSFAEVGTKHNGSDIGASTDINLQTQTGASVSFDGSTVTIPVLDSNLAAAGTGTSGATSMTTTDTDVPVGYTLVRKAISPTVGTVGTMANGHPGEIQTILITTVTGSGTFILRPTTKTGFYQIIFAAAKDRVTLLYVDDTIGWIVLSATGATVNL